MVLLRVVIFEIFGYYPYKTTLNIVNASYSFTQFSSLAKIYTTTAREPSIYTTTRLSGPIKELGILLVVSATLETPKHLSPF